VKVICRCRPMNTREKELDCQKVVIVDRDLMQIRLLKPGETTDPKPFTFDSVFDDDSTQAQVYNDAAFNLVNSVLDGYNGTIFAYGQTGCGKSFTMEGVRNGPDELRGIIPKCFEQIFRTISLNTDTTKQYLIQGAYIEIYNEEVRDLLGSDTKAKLDLKEDPDRGVYVKGLSMHVVKDVQSINTLMEKGNKNRTTGFTLMNADSSRSHSIFMVRIETSEPDPNGKGPEDMKFKAGKLNLVDLAGSERQSKTAAAGVRLKEATKINMSLSALGNVISALVAGKGRHIPYRDSKLTRLLQDSLGGNVKCVMIAALSPASDNYEETLSTLRYANRAKNIKNKPKVNEDPKDAMLREYSDEIKRLKALLAAKGLLKDGEVPPDLPAVALEEEDSEEDEGDEGDESYEESESYETSGAVDEASPQRTKKPARKKQPKLNLDGLTEEEKQQVLQKQAELKAEFDDHLTKAKESFDEQMAMLNAQKSEQYERAAQLNEQMEAEQEARKALEGQKEVVDGEHEKHQNQVAEEQKIAADLAEQLEKQMDLERDKYKALVKSLSANFSTERGKHLKAKGDLQAVQQQVKTEKSNLKSKLEMLQQQLLAGGNKIKDLELKRQQELQKAAVEVEEERLKQARLAQERKKMEEAKAELTSNFANIQEEVAIKTKKLTKLMRQYKAAKEEVVDVQQEWEKERGGYLSNLKDIDKELSLFKQIIFNFISKTEYDKIVRRARYDQDSDNWTLPQTSLQVIQPEIKAREKDSGFAQPRSRRGSQEKTEAYMLAKYGKQAQPKQAARPMDAKTAEQFRRNAEKEMASMNNLAMPTSMDVARRRMDPEEAMAGVVPRKPEGPAPARNALGGNAMNIPRRRLSDDDYQV